MHQKLLKLKRRFIYWGVKHGLWEYQRKVRMFFYRERNGP